MCFVSDSTGTSLRVSLRIAKFSPLRVVVEVRFQRNSIIVWLKAETVSCHSNVQTQWAEMFEAEYAKTKWVPTTQVEGVDHLQAL